MKTLPILLLCICLTACSLGTQTSQPASQTQAAPQAQTSQIPQAPATPMPVVLSMEDQAKAQLKKYLEKHMTTCGDSWVTEKKNGMDGNGIFEYKNPSIIVYKVGAVSEADKLNGVEWYGNLDMNYSAYRRYFENQWSQWRNDRTAEWTFQVVKRTSGWVVEDSLTPRPDERWGRTYNKINCSAVPN